MTAIKHIYLIAGEASGDRLGAQAMEELKARFPSAVFSGIGGAMMQARGLKSLFPMEELSVMGIMEIAPHIPSLLQRIKQTVADIEAKNPDIILSIDSPDFCFRVMKKVKERGITKAKRIHYVAPTVWAWRPGRARKIAAFLDGIICLFPFEPDYFLKEGLLAVFAGHPVMNSGLPSADGSLFREERGITSGQKALGVFLGSRRSEIARHGKIFQKALKEINRRIPGLHIITPTLPHLEPLVYDILKDYPGTVHITSEADMKWSAFKACDAAIAVSGTVGLELAIAGVPHCIAYRASPLTAAIVRRVVKVKYAHLGNILLNRGAIPEYIQEKCTDYSIAREAIAILSDEQKRREQKNAFLQITEKISPPSKTALSAFVEKIAGGA